MRSGEGPARISTEELCEKIDFDKNDPIFLEFMLTGTTIQIYCMDTPIKFYQVVKNKKREMFS